ncbi:hypothetical protein SAMN04488047_1654, partial [Tranquillimonas alkanivorans]
HSLAAAAVGALVTAFAALPHNAAAVPEDLWACHTATIAATSSTGICRSRR